MSNEWDGLLDEDETILWQGRPVVHVSPQSVNWKNTGYGVLTAAVAIYFQGRTPQTQEIVKLFLALLAISGVVTCLRGLVGDSLRRHFTWYTLTTRRAFVACRPLIGRRRLKSYPIKPDTRLDYVDGPRPTIFFAQEQTQSGDSVYIEDIGFEELEDGRKVYSLMRNIQKGMA